MKTRTKQIETVHTSLGGDFVDNEDFKVQIDIGYGFEPCNSLAELVSHMTGIEDYEKIRDYKIANALDLKHDQDYNGHALIYLNLRDLTKIFINAEVLRLNNENLNISQISEMIIERLITQDVSIHQELFVNLEGLPFLEDYKNSLYEDDDGLGLVVYADDDCKIILNDDDCCYLIED